MDTNKSRDDLRQRLNSALKLAEGRSYDLPSTAARRRATALLQLLAAREWSEDELDVSVSEDGLIEITAFSGCQQATIDIHPPGNRTEMVVVDVESGSVLRSAGAANDEDIAGWLGRAA